MGPLWGIKGAGGAVGGSGTHLGCRRSNLPFWGRGAIGNGSGGYGAGLKGSMWQLGHGIGWGSAHGHSGRAERGSGVVSWETPLDYLKVVQWSLLGILGSAGFRQGRDFSS